MAPVSSQHIELIPSANHGEKAVIAGTRIRVVDIYVMHELQGKPVKQIVAEFPQLTPADVHAAMTYYWDNEKLVQQQMKKAGEIEEKMRKKHPPKLPDALERRGNDGDSVSS